MTLVNRGALLREMRTFVAASDEMTTLQRAIDLLNPRHPRPDVADIATSVLYSALRSHEDATSAVLTRMNEAIGRTLDDLATLRAGGSLDGRTAQMRAADLASIAQAMDDLVRLEDRIRDVMRTDPDGSWVHGLRAEAEAAMLRPTAAAPPGGAVTPPATAAAGVAPAVRQIPNTVAGAIVGLRDAIHAVAPAGNALFASRQLPDAVRAAAHDLVVLAGGEVAEAVRRALRSGGEAADDMVLAILWAEGRVQPSTQNLGTRSYDIHQEMVTGLPYELSGTRPSIDPRRAGELVRDIGIDGIRDGLVVDAKHMAGNLEDSAHLIGGAEARRRWADEAFRPTPEGESALYPGDRGLRTYDAVDELDDATRQVSTADRARLERAMTHEEIEIMSQMRRQLEFARRNGLRGIRWVANSAELAAHLQRIMDALDANYSDMVKRVDVGGLGAGGAR